ncbi:MAG: hypothetical protein AB1750_02190 [Chloroflexota bacterium]
MKNFPAALKSPAILSFLLILPFMLLEWINRRSFNEGYPIVLFVILWLLPVIFLVALTPIVRNVRAGNGLLANPAMLLFRVALMGLVAFVWTSLLIDQLPCFMGVQYCD